MLSNKSSFWPPFFFILDEILAGPITFLVTLSLQFLDSKESFQNSLS
jgi:hypothetical protein